MFQMVPLIVCLMQIGYDLDEVVVTATRYPEILEDIAVATLVIEQEDIVHLMPQSVGEVLDKSSGIEVKDFGVPGSVSSVFIRGVPSSGTLVLLDGQPLNTVTTGMADLGAELSRFLQVASVDILENESDGLVDYENSSVLAVKTEGKKCVRCWNYFDRLGSDQQHPELCDRCTDIVKSM